MKNSIVLLLPFIFIGCASSYGVIRNTVSKDTAVVSVGRDPLKVGDKVTVFNQECREIERRNSTSLRCNNISMGQAEVLGLQSDNTAVIKSENGTVLRKDLMVEKIIQ